MKTFNNSDLFTGYLKQLLHTFHLPKIKVYTKQHAQYFEKYGKERPDILGTVEATIDDKTKTVYTKEERDKMVKNVRHFPYIKNGAFQEYVNNRWQNVRENSNGYVPLYKYTYGDKILNYTKNLKIDSNIYDSYTHEYLGDYLRFQRDYLNLDLMPLYNCFSNKACEKLNLSWKTGLQQIQVTFDTTDPDFKIYMIPVKLFKKYTIAIDSETPIEMCCGIYGDYQDTRTKFASLPIQTYKKITKSLFSQPFLYEALAYVETETTENYISRLLASNRADKTTLIELAQNESDLKLFLKVPIQNTSTIVILEGDYQNWNDYIWHSATTDATKNIKRTNKSVINLEHRYKNVDQFKLITPLQLLQFNTQKQHPFADRLIEYLLENAITKTETEIAKNIKRSQQALASNWSTNGYTIGIPGAWSDEMQILFYEYMTHAPETTKRSVSAFEINHDFLGYVDKDVEKFYQAIVPKGSTDKTIVSLLNFEIEEDSN